MSDGGEQPQPQQRPWASPRMQPIKGVVQPRVLPPFGKPTRHTNKLDYIMTVTLKEVSKHKHVWPFQKPVDAQTLCIPLYHERVTRPMDLKTIESRLKSVYYTCAQECIDDIEQVFQNCYTFNGREDDVTIMAQNVHEVIKKSLEQGPREELDMEVHWGKNKKKGGGKDAKAVKKEARGISEAPSEAGSESAAAPAGKPERKVAGKKTGKRKADSDDEDKADSHRVKREVVTVKKEPTQPILPIMRPCSKLLNDFFSKKYSDFAWVFYDPVDALTMGLSDYHTIIKHPMDMKTIKRKLETGVYKEPSEFEADIRLMISNCLTYNPMGDPVNAFGQRFQETFNKRWAELEASATSRPSSVAPPASTVTATPKPPKKESAKAQKEIKQEPAATFFEQGGTSKSEDIMQINNALSMIREREEKLKAELAAAEAMKQKLTTIKSRREGNPNEPFPEKLITETRIMCTTPVGTVTSAGGSSSGSTSASANNSANRNGRTKKSNPSARQHGYDFDSGDEENKPALTYDEKRNLSHMVNRLPAEHLSTIISIIQRRECSALNPESGIDESEIELDFESLGDMCLREMGAFMRSLNLKEDKDGTLISSTSEPPTRPSKAASSSAGAGPSGSGSKGGSVASSSKNDKKKKNFNMSESSDDETSNNRKRRKKESSESESSSSSDDDSDDEGPSVPRKSGQPPSTSREWNQTGAPPPARMGGMGGQPPMARPGNVSTMGKNAPSSSYQSPPQVSKSVPVAPPTVPAVTTTKPAKPTSQAAAATVSAGQPPKKKQATSILDTLLPDTFGSSSSSQMSGPTSFSNTTTSPAQNGTGGPENGENEQARIHRLRMEAKRARQREDENSLSMTNQMEMMTAFEYDNTY